MVKLLICVVFIIVILANISAESYDKKIKAQQDEIARLKALQPSVTAQIQLLKRGSRDTAEIITQTFVVRPGFEFEFTPNEDMEIYRFFVSLTE